MLSSYVAAYKRYSSRHTEERNHSGVLSNKWAYVHFDINPLCDSLKKATPKSLKTWNFVSVEGDHGRCAWTGAWLRCPRASAWSACSEGWSCSSWQARARRSTEGRYAWSWHWTCYFPQRWVLLCCRLRSQGLCLWSEADWCTAQEEQIPRGRLTVVGVGSKWRVRVRYQSELSLSVRDL